MTEDDWSEWALYWWGPDADELTIGDTLDSGSMGDFIEAVLSQQRLSMGEDWMKRYDEALKKLSK
jgi:hypothetical protein